MGNEADSKLLRQIVHELVLIRKEKSLTQAQVLNDTAILIARIEQGKRNMAIITFIKICEYYGVKPSEVLSRVEKKSK